MYTPAAGKSLLTKKGVIVAGAEIKPEYISGGQHVFDELVKKGIIVKSNESIAEVIEEKKEEVKEEVKKEDPKVEEKKYNGFGAQRK